MQQGQHDGTVRFRLPHEGISYAEQLRQRRALAERFAGKPEEESDGDPSAPAAPRVDRSRIPRRPVSMRETSERPVVRRAARSYGYSTSLPTMRQAQHESTQHTEPAKPSRIPKHSLTVKKRSPWLRGLFGNSKGAPSSHSMHEGKTPTKGRRERQLVTTISSTRRAAFVSKTNCSSGQLDSSSHRRTPSHVFSFPLSPTASNAGTQATSKAGVSLEGELPARPISEEELQKFLLCKLPEAAKSIMATTSRKASTFNSRSGRGALGQSCDSNENDAEATVADENDRRTISAYVQRTPSGKSVPRQSLSRAEHHALATRLLQHSIILPDPDEEAAQQEALKTSVRGVLASVEETLRGSTMKMYTLPRGYTSEAQADAAARTRSLPASKPGAAGGLAQARRTGDAAASQEAGLESNSSKDGQGSKLESALRALDVAEARLVEEIGMM